MSDIKLFTEEEGAKLIGVHFNTMRKYRAEKKISYMRVGKVVRFTKEHIENFIKENTIEKQ